MRAHSLARSCGDRPRVGETVNGPARAPLARLLALVTTAVLLAALPLSAQREPVAPKSTTLGTPQTEAVARAAMFQLRSPVTPSHTLDMCPAEAAEALRDTLRMAAAQGETVDELVEGVIARYGEQMRIVPKRSGAGLWAWVLPPAVLILGAGLVVMRLRALRGRRGSDDPAPTAITEEDRERLAAALAGLEEVEAER